MKSLFWGIVAGLALIAVVPALAVDGAAVAQTITLQTTCPVMGSKIDKSLYVDYEGKRIYVCCAGCINALKKDPLKAIRKLEADGVTVASLQTTCPVLGGKIDKSLYVDYEGRRVYVCCAGCLDTLAKAPARYVQALEEKGVAFERTPEKEK